MSYKQPFVYFTNNWAYSIILVAIIVTPEPKSVVPKRSGSNFASVFFKLILRIEILSTYSDVGFRWVPQNPVDLSQHLVQVMACCCQAAIHYLGQCWLSPMLVYGVNRPQSVKYAHSVYFVVFLVVMLWLILPIFCRVAILALGISPVSVKQHRKTWEYVWHEFIKNK